MVKIKRLSEFSDQLGFMVLAIPDHFPKLAKYSGDLQENILLAFKELEDGFCFVEEKIKDQTVLARLRKLMNDSLAAYLEGDRKKGRQLLLEIDSTVFPDRFKEYEERKGIV